MVPEGQCCPVCVEPGKSKNLTKMHATIASLHLFLQIYVPWSSVPIHIVLMDRQWCWRDNAAPHVWSDLALRHFQS